MTQSEFYNLPEVKATIEIEKNNPFGSIESRQAWKERKLILISIKGEEFAKKHMGSSYE